ACFLGLLVLGLATDNYPAKSPGLQASLSALALILLPALGFVQLFSSRRPAARLLGAGLCLLAVSDLTRYYADGCRADQAFTTAHYGCPRPVPLPDDTCEALASVWTEPEPDELPFNAVFANMPVHSNFWPANHFNPHRYYHELSDPEIKSRKFARLPGRLLTFFYRADTAEPEQLWFRDEDSRPFRWRIASWGYNRNKLRATVPEDGWFFIHQLHDPAWRVYVDGVRVASVRANLTGMAIPVRPGEHEVVLEFRPRSRR